MNPQIFKPIDFENITSSNFKYRNRLGKKILAFKF